MINPADLPDPDDEGFIQRYLESCKMSVVTPVLPGRLRELVTEWNRAFAAAFAGRRDDAPPTH